MKRHLELATKSIIHTLNMSMKTASGVSNKEHHTYPNMSMKRHLELASYN